MSLLGRLSIVGAPAPEGGVTRELLRRAMAERTLAIICRNLGIPCPCEAEIIAVQVQAAHQAEEIARHVRFLPLKGLHLAHHVYPSPALRDMGDIDLLVRPADLCGAHEALARLGYRSWGGTPRSSATGTF